jgi:hypothetical protein
MHKSATKCNETQGKWCKNKHGASKIIDTFETYHSSRKSISPRKLDRLQEEIVVILCELKMYFLPAFFDIMVHLLVHIVEDIVQLGPMFDTSQTYL